MVAPFKFELCFGFFNWNFISISKLFYGLFCYCFIISL